MLKKAPSVVLASLKACDVPQRVRLGSSLAVALLGGLFEHPVVTHSMKQRVVAAITLSLAIGFSAGCTFNGESGFRSSDPKLMQELQIALTEAQIAFRQDEEGFIRYQKKDAMAVAQILKELSSGIVVKYEDPESNQYLRKLLTSMGLTFRVEKRTDGEWTRWYPKNEEQRKEVHMKVVQREFEVKKKLLSTKCKETTSASKKSLNSKTEQLSHSC
jgi:hypothetical protein